MVMVTAVHFKFSIPFGVRTVNQKKTGLLNFYYFRPQMFVVGDRQMLRKAKYYSSWVAETILIKQKSARIAFNSILEMSFYQTVMQPKTHYFLADIETVAVEFIVFIGWRQRSSPL